MNLHTCYSMNLQASVFDESAHMPFDESAHMLFDESAGICFRSICKQILHLSANRQGISNVLDQLFIQWHSINRHFKGNVCN